MAQLADLVATLTDLAIVEPSEFTSTQLGNYILGALQQHNPSLTLATLPVIEEECVVTLAWIKVCLLRASAAAKQGSVHGASGYGQDRDTPYTKNMNMAKMLRERYVMLCEAADVQNSDGQIVIGQLKVRDQLFDALVPFFVSEDMPDVLLTVDNPTDTTSDFFILHWKMKDFSNFLSFYVYALVGNGTDSIYQAWNYTSATGVPCLNDAATRVVSFNTFDTRACKMTGIDKTVQVRFMIVVRSASNRYAFSNELVWSGATQSFATDPVLDSSNLVPASQVTTGTVIVSATPPDAIGNPALVGSIWQQPGAQQAKLFTWNATLQQWINIVDGQSYAP